MAILIAWKEPKHSKTNYHYCHTQTDKLDLLAITHFGNSERSFVQRAQARSHAIELEYMTSPRNTYRDPESRRESTIASLARPTSAVDTLNVV